uniref:Nidogen n=1 Tax=Panagrellus redivivus TaxID=6233 RepID=A0A7E4VRT2_PANRE
MFFMCPQIPAMMSDCRDATSRAPPRLTLQLGVAIILDVNRGCARKSRAIFRRSDDGNTQGLTLQVVRITRATSSDGHIMKTLWGYVIFLLILRTVALREVRRRRQVDFGTTSTGPQIDLNITVPYIFSARLYPYGPSKDDKLVQVDPTAYNLQTPLKLLQHTYNSIYVHKDGFVSLAGDNNNGPVPLIAVYWMKTKTHKVHFRETTDSSILNVAHNEVNIQYRYGSEFKPSSVAIITWETNDGNGDGNIFQLALILGDGGCFAHIVYSKLTLNSDAVAGFTSDDETSTYFALPGSGTSEAIRLVEKSNIGIPGEWLFRIDAEQIYLCGAGFTGLECVDSCQPNQWYLDCAKQCHCADGNSCNSETGECPEGRCNPGWSGSPVCDQDIDECAQNGSLCPVEQPDCVNTPGAYLCLCFEYDNSTNSCLGGTKNQPTAATIAVPIMNLQPQLPNFGTSQKPTTTRRPRPVVGSNDNVLITTTPVSTTQKVTQATVPTLFTARTQSLSCFNCASQATCHNGRCECRTGWQGDGHTCTDIDECLHTQPCGANAACQNTPGSYQCVCNVGFIANADGCTDVDECAEGIVECPGGNTTACFNTIGGYECQCKEGFAGNAQTGCQDVDECKNADFYCGAKSACLNLHGSYRCECLEGYEKLGNVCTDINECLHNPCDPAAVCTNVEGSFKCDCIDGFVGNGIECHETILFPTPGHSHISNAAVSLNHPITLFGNKYDKLYIADRGVVSFDRPFYEPIPDATEIRSAAFFPLYRQNATAAVSFAEIGDDDAGNYSLLTRASLTVQNKFRQNDFRAKTMVVITFRQNTGSTFQVVLAQSSNASYVTYLYENVEDTHDAVSGISYNGGYFGIPMELLVHNSNIGQRGKWAYRVDRAAGIITCPAGLLGAPLCQQDCAPGTWGFECANKCRCADNIPCDFGTGYCANGKCAPGFKGSNCYDDIDECDSGISGCHEEATCTNTIGSYQCTCNANFFGDGFNCLLRDKCHKKYGVPCSMHAECMVHEFDNAECICNDGFAGDGRECAPTKPTLPPAPTTLPVTTSTTPYTTTVVEHKTQPKLSSESVESVDETPFIMNNWISAENSQPKPPSTQMPITTVHSKHPTTTHIKPKLTPTPHEPIGKEYVDIDNGIFDESIASIDDKDDETDESATLFVIILPAILIIVWLILMAIILAVCCRRRQRTRTNKYNLEMMGWTGRDYTSPRSGQFSHFVYT